MNLGFLFRCTVNLRSHTYGVCKSSNVVKPEINTVQINCWIDVKLGAREPGFSDVEKPTLTNYVVLVVPSLRWETEIPSSPPASAAGFLRIDRTGVGLYRCPIVTHFYGAVIWRDDTKCQATIRKRDPWTLRGTHSVSFGGPTIRSSVPLSTRPLLFPQKKELSRDPVLPPLEEHISVPRFPTAVFSCHLFQDSQLVHACTPVRFFWYATSRH